MKNFLSSKKDDFLPNLFREGSEVNLFDRFFKEYHYPKVDIKEVEDHYEVQMDVPGFAKEDVNVTYKDGYLEVQGTREENKETKEEEGHYVRKERSYGSFKRSFYVGDVDENNVKGSFKNGILMLNVPKPSEENEQDKGKQIQIE
ncbi:Hsp20/alpha crystallin family protein [Planococcus sp. ISL-110]|uniref:Hsp20/alpha crystallin family protein n=1 Tax=Planococcus sp. ISL-110 TaxID=2819167 RepID=UPI001BEB5F9A|nr:Hsp20/alpha crystallin family protein [Planococcus sp. ISL-110]MBT2570069.1 Hsp20/alpha crystallin family protein [Planococcus sp. ISL-110]